jgi:hypothetical protein
MMKIKDAVEHRLIDKMPEEMREPLREAKKNLWLAFCGLVNHLTEETNTTTKPPCSKKVTIE